LVLAVRLVRLLLTDRRVEIPFLELEQQFIQPQGQGLLLHTAVGLAEVPVAKEATAAVEAGLAGITYITAVRPLGLHKASKVGQPITVWAQAAEGPAALGVALLLQPLLDGVAPAYVLRSPDLKYFMLGAGADQNMIISHIRRDREPLAAAILAVMENILVHQLFERPMQGQILAAAGALVVEVQTQQ
jgi:hypothetical protein